MPLPIEQLLSELVQIPSVNPLQHGERSGEQAEGVLAAHLAERFEQLGGSSRLHQIEPGRSNFYATFEGQSDSTLAVDIHLDTVGVEHVEGDPFEGRIEDGRVYGRGSVDTKATFAVLLAVLDELAAADRRPVPTVEVVGTISEEGGGLAGANAYRDMLADAGERRAAIVVAEPTLCAPVYGHKGGLGLEVAITGVAAHSSKPQLGVSAISAAARIVNAVEAEQARLAEQGPLGQLTPGTVSVTEIAGGRARNIIPDYCELYLGRRTADGEDYEVEFQRLAELVQRQAHPATVEITQAFSPGSNAFFQQPDCALVQSLSELSGCEPTTADYGSNALRYSEVADQIVVFGPGSIDQAHQAVEWVEVDQLYKAADIYRQLFSRPL